MRVAHVTPEVVPFSKTGGLADVVGALPQALAAEGLEVLVVAPAHRASLADRVPGDAILEVGAMGLRATVHRVDRQGVGYLLLDCPQLFVRPALYALPDGEFPDNAVRFAFFARAAVAALAAVGGIDVVHAHDWQACLVPLLLAEGLVEASPVSRARTVVTVHNLAYQGTYPPWVLDACGLPRSLFTVQRLEYYGQVNFLKGGLVTADAVTTVSPTYAREILTPAFGCGLEGVLAGRRNPPVGILNGLDTAVWDPATDPALPRAFDATSVTAGKKAAKAELAASTGLDGERPLAAMVSRLAEQKGADLVSGALDELLGLGFDLVVLGTGERRYEELLRAAQLAHPGRISLQARFDERLAHLIYAASDCFLMPSRYEPCGLGQMIAMRYGSIPVVHATGGLADTVTDIDAGDHGTGIVLDELSVSGLGRAAGRARALLDDVRATLRVRRAGMARDVSWTASARSYVALYRSLGG